MTKFNPDDIPSRFDFADSQARIFEMWQSGGYFHAEPDESKPPYTIVIPPPNVTGALHLGHALNNTLQDTLIRMKRMQGFNALWMPGTDHAGIVTQAVVERRLKEDEGKTRHDLGREKLVERIWQWKEQYEARILGQALIGILTAVATGEGDAAENMGIGDEGSIEIILGGNGQLEHQTDIIGQFSQTLKDLF